MLVVVNGGDGNDLLTGQGANIGDVRLRLDGNAGNDTIIGSNGNDSINGGTGNDTVGGQPATTRSPARWVIIAWRVDASNDTVDGGNGNDS